MRSNTGQVASFALSGYTRESQWDTLTSPNPNGYISDRNVPPASAERKQLLSSKLYFDLPDRKPCLAIKDGSTNYFKEKC